MQEPTLGPPPDEPRTRPPLPLWDRVKFVLLFVGIWSILVWNTYIEIEIVGGGLLDAAEEQLQGGAIWLFLAWLEVLRQLHYMLSERWAGWHQFWSKRVFGAANRRVARLNDWNRYRLGRVLKVLAGLVVLAYVLGQIYDVPATTALLELPATVYAALPLVLQVVFLMFAVVMQFVAIFWFMSKGGVEVLMPNDVRTRFTDVWGQDQVVDRVKENLVFLEAPEKIEEKGGYIPSGILLWGPPGTGKTLVAEAAAGETGKPFVFVEPGAFAQPVSGRVLTPEGWRKMGDVGVGSRVIGRSGEPCTVLGVYPQGEQDIYTVTFSDGATAQVTAEHLWAVQTAWQREANRDRWTIKRTEELTNLRVSHRKGWRYSVPQVAPVRFARRDVPLDPYVLGVLVGDGCFTGSNIQLTNATEGVVERVVERLPRGVTVTGTAPRFRFTGTDHERRPVMRTMLRDLGLDLRRAEDKFVPDIYLYNDVATRTAVLQGILDTDGCVHRSASGKSFVTFGTASPRLRDDVIELVRSLGGLATCTERRTRSEWQKLPFWDLHLRLPNDVMPFAAKAEKLVPRTRAIRRYITNVEWSHREDAQCILVDAPDHLYVCDDYVVTHNTNMFFGVGVLKVKTLFRRIRKLSVRYGGVVVFFDEADALGNRGRLATGGSFPGSGATPAVAEPATWAAATACNGLHYLSPTSATLTLQTAMDRSTGDEHPRRWRDGIIMPGMGGGDVMALQALLAEIQGLKKPRGFFNRVVRRVLGMRPKPPPKYRILLMMATNLPEALDEALLRPGRIDRIYKVGYPSKAGRIRTYEGYLEKVSHSLSTEEIDKLATITPYATGATIKDLVNEALINAIREDRATIEWRDVIRAKQLRELGLPEDVEYIDRERHAIAVHEACHAVSAYRVRHHLTIDIATLEKGGNYLGMVASIPPEDQFTRWRSEYEADIIVSLASLAGERMFFAGDNSSGVSGDLETATLIATFMEGYWGMGQTIASHGVSHRLGIGGGGGGPKPGEPGGKSGKEKELLEGHLGGRIERKLADLFTRTEELLRDNRTEVLAVAHALERHKTLTGDDVKAVIDGTRGPLIDGRVYHAPGAAKTLEEYHRTAAEAHVSHGRVDVELPALVDIAANGSGNGRRARRAPRVTEDG